MAQVIYNEGRVTGYSSYEVYVKQAQSIDPNTEPATERQWLASSLAMGTSLLFKLPMNTTHDDDTVWMYEASLPVGSRLCAANTIMANYFQGDAELLDGSDVWASKVTDYGNLISNTSSSSPSGDSVPSKTITDLSDDDKTKLACFLKIQDGIVYQPGTWTTNSSTPPQKDFTPDLSKTGTLRLQIKGKISQPVWILFTGFTNRVVVMGESGLDSAVNTPSPEDGDFLGPGQYPWASKIVFGVSSSIANEMRNGVGAGSKNVTIYVDPDSLETYISVDNVITSINPYLTVTQTNDGGNTVLDLDGDGLVRNALQAGTGILLNNLSSGKTQIQTNLEGGTGIKITNSSSDTKQTIATNIAAGAGISVNENTSTGQLTIINTVANNDYTNLTNKNNYEVRNDTSSHNNSVDYQIYWYNNFYAGTSDYDNRSGGTNPNTYGHGTLIVQVAPSYSGTTMTECKVKISSNSDDHLFTKYGNLNEGNFSFRHTYPVSEVPESRIFFITFPQNGDWAALSNTSSSTYSTDINPRIWNVSAYYDGKYNNVRASWSVTLDLNTYTDGSENTVSGRRCYLISATSIADGWNSQYYEHDYASYTLYARLLHLSVEFTIKI